MTRKPYPKRPEVERFHEKYTKGDGCWEWTGNLIWTGYGRFCGTRTNGKCVEWVAHRYSWIAHNGPIPDGLFVLHRCDNRKCVRPDHLFLGTKADNSRDMVQKGRHRPAGLSGERHPRAKLTENAVREIIRRRRNGESRSDVAKDYGVPSGYISKITGRYLWKRVVVS